MSQAIAHDTTPKPQPLLLRRLDSLDLLRGVAILGIFLMNTWTMSLPQNAYTNLNSYTPSWIPGQGFPENTEMVHGVEYTVYVFIHLFADMKFITMFSMMFGAGILLQGQRAQARGLSAAGIHYARMAVLLVFGLFHAYFLWYGDILFDYAICGMLLFPLRRLPGVVLATLGIALISMVSFISWFNAHQADNPGLQQLYKMTLQPVYAVNTWLYYGGNDLELEAYRTGYLHEMHHRALASFRGQTTGFLTWTFFRCGGAILVGMALQRWRFFHGAWPRWSYPLIALFAVPLGCLITYRGILYNQAHWWDDTLLWAHGVEYNYWGSLVTELGYISLGVFVAILAAKPAHWLLNRLLVPIRSVGRTALSNYILQTLIGTTIFYGHGFGLFGYLSRLQLLAVVGAVWTFQLVVSPIWLSYFRQGPLEWLWHKIVYLGREPAPLVAGTAAPGA